MHSKKHLSLLLSTLFSILIEGADAFLLSKLNFTINLLAGLHTGRKDPE